MRPLHACGYVLLISCLIGGLVSATAATVTVTASQAHVRAGPNTTFSPVTVVARGAVFPLLGSRQGWHQIRLEDGRTGWIAGSIVRVDEERYPFRSRGSGDRNDVSLGMWILVHEGWPRNCLHFFDGVRRRPHHAHFGTVDCPQPGTPNPPAASRVEVERSPRVPQQWELRHRPSSATGTNRRRARTASRSPT